VSEGTETKVSPIHGLGLFTKRNFKKDVVVAAWGGRVITKNEMKKLPKNISSNYALEIFPNFFLAETSNSDLDKSDFINHSCTPNCKIVNRLVMVTKGPVKKGAELTCDFSAPIHTGKKVPCKCGSSACRGFIYFD